LKLAQTRTLIRILKRASEEPPFTPEEMAIAALLAAAWRPVAKEAKSRLSEIIDFEKGAYKGGFFDADMLLEDDMLYMMEQGWNEAKTGVVYNVNHVYEKGHHEEGVDDDLQGEVLTVLGGHVLYYYRSYLPRRVVPRVQTLNDRLYMKDLTDSQIKKAVDGLSKTLDGSSYFQGVATQNASRAFHFGFLDWCEVRHVIRYMWYAIGDDRTCPICGGLHGTTFDVQETQGMKRDFLSAGTDVDAANEVFPVPTKRDIEGMSRAALSISPYRLPPIHPFCRCWVEAVP
jgi:hypothetical protein